MVKSAKTLKRKSLNSSQWEEAALSDDEPPKRKLVVAPPESDEDDDEEDVVSDHSEPESEQNSEANDDSEPESEEPTAANRSKVKLVTPLKKKKTGIIYISSIPKHMNVTILRELLEPYGDVGRIYLQPERKGWYIFFT